MSNLYDTASVTDEAARLGALERIGLLGTPREAAFDEIVAHLADSLQTPMAIFSLVNSHREWFKSSVGIPSSGLDREITFSDLVVTHDAPLVVPDARADERLRTNQFVTGHPSLRAYAGVPVRSSGLPIGVLAVLDVVPREFDDRMLSTLRFLGRQIEHLVDLHARRAAELPPQTSRVVHAATQLSDGMSFERVVAPFDRAAFVFDLETLRFVAVNDAAVDRYGWTRDEFLAMTMLDIRPPSNGVIVESMIRDMGTFVYDDDRIWKHLRADGEEIDVKVVGAPTVWDGRPARLTVATDVTTQLVINDAIKHAALSDDLTGLANRREFVRLLGERLEQETVSPLAVFFIDLDRFKLVNDTMGHEAGDALLGAASARIRAQAPGALLIARLGGDEFAVLQHVSDVEEAASIADQIRVALEAPFAIEGSELFVSASIGVATNVHGSTAQGLLSEADTAMYAAKESGRNGCVVFDQALREETEEWTRVRRDLRHAIDDGQFELHLQRIHRVGDETGPPLAYEGLARWNHPTRGLMSPYSFIEVAEDSGQIVALGSRLLEIGAAHAAALDAPVCVNVSVRQFNRALVAEVKHLIEVNGLRPGQLIIEITESAVIDTDYAETILKGLRRAGAHIWIDDFGTGFSSLGRLSSLTVDGFKLARAFVQDLDTQRGWGIARAIQGIASALDVIVVAEGVETTEQLAQVDRLGCHAVQGFLLDRPGPAADEIAAAAGRLTLSRH